MRTLTHERRWNYTYQFPHTHINGDTMPNIDINETLQQQQQSLDAVAERLSPTPEADEFDNETKEAESE